MTGARERSKVTALLAHAAALVVCIAAAGSGGCGKSGSVVGGACGTGYTQCANECVDLQSDPANCGGCGHACATGVACAHGTCAGTSVSGNGEGGVGGPDSGSSPETSTDSAGGSSSSGGDATTTPVDGSVGVDAPAESSSTDSSTDSAGDGPSGDGSTDGAPGDDAAGQGDDGGTGDDGCSPPFDTPEHCGDCVTSCTPDMPICSPTEGGPPTCAAQCDVQYLACGSLCIDPTSDPYNCGGCGKVCGSNICYDGVCAGSTPGEIVVIGHDYFGVVPGTAEAQVLSNAALLPTANPLRILSFEEYASATSVAHVKAIINAAAKAQARTVAFTVSTSDADIPARLTRRNFDLLLVYDQATADAPTLSAMGGSWTTTLSNYLSVGGAVVALDGAEGLGQMPSLLSQSALLNVSAHATLAYRAPLSVSSLTDAVATGVLNPYGALPDSVSMTTDAQSQNLAYVVVDGSGNPVVVHKTVP